MFLYAATVVVLCVLNFRSCLSCFITLVQRMRLILLTGQPLPYTHVKPLVKFQRGICMGSTVFSICYCTLKTSYLTFRFNFFLLFFFGDSISVNFHVKTGFYNQSTIETMILKNIPLVSCVGLFIEKEQLFYLIKHPVLKSALRFM